MPSEFTRVWPRPTITELSTRDANGCSEASGDAASTPSDTSALTIGGRGSRPMAALRVVQHQATSNKLMKADAAEGGLHDT
jgi:hypothetical protein